MAKEEGDISKNIEISLDLTEKNLRGGNLLKAKRALTVAFNYAKSYEGPGRKSYLKRIEKAAIALGQDKTLEDYQFEYLRDIENSSARLQHGPQIFMGFIGAIALVTSFFFLSSNITGNAVANLSQNSSNWIGGILFVVGILGILNFIKK